MTTEWLLDNTPDTLLDNFLDVNRRIFRESARVLSFYEQHSEVFVCEIATVYLRERATVFVCETDIVMSPCEQHSVVFLCEIARVFVCERAIVSSLESSFLRQQQPSCVGGQ